MGEALCRQVKGTGICIRRSIVVVDPGTGRVNVDKEDAPGLIRSWDGRRWTVNGGESR